MALITVIGSAFAPIQSPIILKVLSLYLLDKTLPEHLEQAQGQALTCFPSSEPLRKSSTEAPLLFTLGES